jgi:voltage-gated potassium channel
VIPYLAGVTVLVTVGAALFVEVFSPKSFDSFGDALWWAAQTVTTVGYGDVVPQR